MSLEQQLCAAQSVLADLRRFEKTFDAIADATVETLRAGHKVLACGNGGSAAEAQHLVTELVGRYRYNRKSLPSIYLGGDASLITCITNDFSFDEIFSRPLASLGTKGDLLFCFTTSGNSSNVLRALEQAKTMGVRTVALLGKGGGPMKGRADFEIIVGSDQTARVQEAHLFLLHALCDRIEAAFPVAGA